MVRVSSEILLRYPHQFSWYPDYRPAPLLCFGHLVTIILLIEGKYTQNQNLRLNFPKTGESILIILFIINYATFKIERTAMYGENTSC